MYIFLLSLVFLLFQFYRDNWPLQCEVDAYGDFLQALGPDATAKVLYYHIARTIGKEVGIGGFPGTPPIIAPHGTVSVCRWNFTCLLWVDYCIYNIGDLFSHPTFCVCIHNWSVIFYSLWIH